MLSDSISLTGIMYHEISVIWLHLSFPSLIGNLDVWGYNSRTWDDNRLRTGEMIDNSLSEHGNS